MKAIGENLLDTVQFYRDEASRYRELADAVDEAWGAWDVDRLLALGVLSESEAKQLREEQ